MSKRKSKSPSMTLAQFGALKSVSRQAVRAAVERGDIPPRATLWVKRGKRKVLMIVDVPLASNSWTPPAEQPLPSAGGSPVELNDSTSMADAKRLIAVARAKQANLEFEQASGKLISLDEAMSVTTRHLVEARNAFLALPNRLRNRCPAITFEVTEALDKLVREILTDLSEMPAKVKKLARAGKGKRP